MGLDIAKMQLHRYNYNMDFVWDEAKDFANIRKHGISFADARHVFDDPLAITRMDHHESEPRWQILGHWGSMILMLVVYTIRTMDGYDQVRVISARRASAAERRQYEKSEWFQPH